MKEYSVYRNQPAATELNDPTVTTQRVAILGYGVEGKSAWKYWSVQGADITICDARKEVELPEGVQARLGQGCLDELDGFDLLVRSPGVPRHLIKTSVPITSVTREFMAKCPAPIIGVTGTKGKGTTATLISKILEADGYKVWLGGNIGRPALDFLDQVEPSDWVVLELSSFQLEDVTQSPQIAVCLMIAPDHLDHHRHMEEYIQAKGNIFRYQTKNDLAVYDGAQTEPARLAQLSPGDKVPYFTPEGAFVRDDQVWFREESICAVSEVGLLGRHNLENVCAAVAATHQLVKDKSAMVGAIKQFKGLEHRLEEVAEVEGVRYVNDSFAANPVAAVAALKAFVAPKVVILGGFDRKVGLDELAEAVKSQNVRYAILIGQTAPELAKLLRHQGYEEFELGAGTMPQIVATAKGKAQAGDVVLLSPGCPSFDMFKDFKERGDQFRQVVLSLNKQSTGYQRFIFESYKFDPESKRLELHYSFDDGVHFVETFSFDFEFADGYSQEAMDRACFGLFMLAGVSYYKAGLPPQIELRQGKLNQAEADFLSKTYRLGLGEFCYRNNLPLVNPVFPVSAGTLGAVEVDGLQGCLVPVGGGKDSLTTVELLKGAGEEIVTWMVNHNDQIGPLTSKMSVPHLAVTREIAPELIRLNQAGALNGHVPITGILALTGVVSAILAGKASVVESMEWSAGEGNAQYEGIMVNHQYSKSFEFEQDLASFVKQSITPSVEVFSLLRPLSELKIAETFCKAYLDKYEGSFSSCNRNFHLGDHGSLFWCGQCPKCAFVYLIFAPFLPKKRLVALFGGKSLFESEQLKPTYDELLGLSGHKPFECVGEINECRQAVIMAQATGEYPELARYCLKDPQFDYRELHSDLIPAKYKGLIESL